MVEQISQSTKILVTRIFYKQNKFFSHRVGNPTKMTFPKKLANTLNSNIVVASITVNLYIIIVESTPIGNHRTNLISCYEVGYLHSQILAPSGLF